MSGGARWRTDSIARVSNQDFRAHETSIIEPDARIGAGTAIWHHAHVRSGATIGSGCVLGKNVFVDSDAVVGDRVKIQNNVSVYSGVTIGNDVFVGPSAVFTNDLVPRAFNTHWQITPTTVADGASIGANATIVCGSSIGHHAMVAAGATVTHDVEPHQLVAGLPARHRGWVCACGAVISRGSDAPAEFSCEPCKEGTP